MFGWSCSQFHVKFLSTNHFCISVASKQVGFWIYRLWRVISSCFDVYFHLWNNGTPHWEREKRAWEEEQEREWTKVLSKQTKKAAKNSSPKRVSFAKKLVQSPPRVKKSPPRMISFGAFTFSLNSFDETLSNRSFGSITFLRSKFENDDRDLRQISGQRPDEFTTSVHAFQMEQPMAGNKSSNSLVPATGPPCSRCLAPSHARSECRGKIRCWACFKGTFEGCV